MCNEVLEIDYNETFEELSNLVIGYRDSRVFWIKIREEIGFQIKTAKFQGG